VRGTLALLILATLTAAISLGCGAGSVGSSQQSAGRQAPETANSSATESPGQKAEDTSASGQIGGGKLGHPTLGSADAPVVLTEYSDYQ
jgi:protein-disulfide isomerase